VEDLTKLKMETLIDMLARHTNDYMRILKDGSSKEEYESCKDWINRLTAEIESRKRKEKN
jgi:hypothetical protein